MSAKYALSLLASLAMVTLLSCGYDTPLTVGSCPPESEVGEVQVWRDRAILYPRHPASDLLPMTLWQGIDRTMSRSEVEALLASYLRSRQPYWSEFETPLGRLQWRLDREVSGGDEAKIPRIYLYPSELSLDDVLSAASADCLWKATSKPKDVMFMRSKGKGQLATVVVEGHTIKQIIWRQSRI
jgi:hypothetical protein